MNTENTHRDTQQANGKFGIFGIHFSVDESGSINSTIYWPDADPPQELKGKIANLLYCINGGLLSDLIMTALMDSASNDPNMERHVSDVASKILEIKSLEDDVCVKPTVALGPRL